LAIALDQGLPLDKALAASDIQLPNDALVAVRAGCATGSLAPLLKSTSRYVASMDAAIQAAVGRIVYLLIFMFFASFTIAYMQIKIVPAFIKIFSDFHQRLPPVALAFSRPLFHAPTFLTLVAVLFTCLLMAFLYTLARYTGLLRWDPPIVRRMTLPLDEALVLRSLAESVDDQKPLDATLWVLAKRYPKRHVRRRLRRAAERVNEGAHWCDSLQANRLLTAADAGVLKAAGRVGNLSWAMNNAADRLVRRFTTRLLGVMSVCFPLVVLMFGAVVFLLAVGLIFPLAQLILHLA
jgi:type II secretory pathway component PulF